MSMNRRDFLAWAATACAGSCPLAKVLAADGAAQVIDAGPAANFAADGVYDAFRTQGFFVIRQGGRLFALSSICTHRAVQLKAQADGSFYCRRHGSRFSPGGHVLEGPARRDLPVLATSVSGGHLFVSVPAI